MGMLQLTGLMTVVYAACPTGTFCFPYPDIAEPPLESFLHSGNGGNDLPVPTGIDGSGSIPFLQFDDAGFIISSNDACCKYVMVYEFHDGRLSGMEGAWSVAAQVPGMAYPVAQSGGVNTFLKLDNAETVDALGAITPVSIWLRYYV